MRTALDRTEVSVKDGTVACVMRQKRVPVERCLDCTLLVGARPHDAPRTIVCEGYVVSSWLGMLGDAD
ncbi:MAG TPA: hypothetical protein VFM93_14120 [Candidatus Limnocylindria bacterium]|nr:hypothetical protein [Candidatus Limnocylindria bacterium]